MVISWKDENSKLSLINEVSRTPFCRNQITYLLYKVSIDFIAQYSTDIVYIPGSIKVVADRLSKTQCNALFESISLISMTKLATAQQNDRDLLNFLNNNNSKFNVEMRSISDCDLNLIGVVSTSEF